ncbi:MAG: hypothetical protein ACRDT4_01905 [Micromonosporaceae bacterium]
MLRLFLQLDDELGGDALYPLLAQYVGRLAVAVQGGHQADLVGFGQLAQLAGWLALDANLQAPARRYFTTALYVAHEADDPALAASSLAYMSLQETYAARPQSALALAQTAVIGGSSRLTRLTRTMLGTRLARAHANLGQRTDCERVIDRTRTSFAESGEWDEPQWLSYVDEVEVAAQEGACYLALGMTAEASAALNRAISLLTRDAPHRVRDHVHYLSRLATCHLVDGDVEGACGVAVEGLTLATAIGSARVFDRLHEFRAALRPHHRVAAVRAFEERFEATMPVRDQPATGEGPG